MQTTVEIKVSHWGACNKTEYLCRVQGVHYRFDIGDNEVKSYNPVCIIRNS